MNRLIFVIIAGCFCLPGVVERANAQRPRCYSYLSNIEHTPQNDIIWWTRADSVWGTVRSNDLIGLDGIPFLGPYARFITSRQFSLRQGQIPDSLLYRFYGNVAPENFPARISSSVRAAAMPFISDRGGRMMTWIRLVGDAGLRIYQYPLGMIPRESLVWDQGPPLMQSIYIDGQVEIEGTLTGILTIGSSGNMWLIDNVKYSGSNPRTGYFGDETWDEAGAMHMLGLVSERNIIIKNNWRNGKEDGWNTAPNDFNRHSIAINAVLVALGESFTFEQQNDDWDMYQGPTPDERGTVFIKGALFQQRRGWLHRDNHQSTGYKLSLRFDNRLSSWPPPYLSGLFARSLVGSYDRLELTGGTYNVSYVVVRHLTIAADSELILDGPSALTITENLFVNGTAEHPVIFRTLPGIGHLSLVRVGPAGWQSVTSLQHAQFRDGIEFTAITDSLNLNCSTFPASVILEGRIFIDSCRFAGWLDGRSWREFHLSRSILTDGLRLGGRIQDGAIVNNTIVSASYNGVQIEGRDNNLRLVNNIIAFNRRGVYSVAGQDLSLTYNDVFDNWWGDYVDCAPGAGSISADPRFADIDRSDYRLLRGSPCINAGDPTSPPDPDGSRADIGALVFDPTMSVRKYIDDMDFIDDMDIRISPNPFNRTAQIWVKSQRAGLVQAVIYDTRGSEIWHAREWAQNGEVVFRLDKEDLNTAGVYLAQINCGRASRTTKVAFIP